MLNSYPNIIENVSKHYQTKYWNIIENVLNNDRKSIENILKNYPNLIENISKHYQTNDRQSIEKVLKNDRNSIEQYWTITQPVSTTYRNIIKQIIEKILKTYWKTYWKRIESVTKTLGGPQNDLEHITEHILSDYMGTSAENEKNTKAENGNKTKKHEAENG